MHQDRAPARSPLFHTPAGRNYQSASPDSGAISNLSLFHVSPPHTHAMSSNILEDCLSPERGDCAHTHIGTQPDGEVSGQRGGRCRVQSLSHPLFQHTIRDDRSRDEHNKTTRQHNAQNERDDTMDCRLPSLPAAAQNHAFLAGGTPLPQPTKEGGTHSLGAL